MEKLETDNFSIKIHKNKKTIDFYIRTEQLNEASSSMLFVAYLLNRRIAFNYCCGNYIEINIGTKEMHDEIMLKMRNLDIREDSVPF